MDLRPGRGAPSTVDRSLGVGGAPTLGAEEEAFRTGQPWSCQAQSRVEELAPGEGW